MNAALRERWLKLAAEIHWQSDTAAVWTALHTHYTEPGRAYHNLTHIHACLTELDAAPVPAQDRSALELALWFHDVIYDAKAKDNEAMSSKLFQSFAAEAKLNPALVADVARLILITKHDKPTVAADEQWIVDIDLSILGSDPIAFARYEEQIRLEYAWVPQADFCKGRAAVLEHFQQRERLYTTPYFFQRYEAKARTNLAAAITRWRSADF
jgi:predicted metal-dependent HD superfamily phosphohydrolase